MLDGSLLRSVDLSTVASLKQERTHILHEKLTTLRVHDIQAVVVDQHGLLLEPVAPAVLADFRENSLPNRSRKRGTVKTSARGAAAGTGQIRHGKLGREE
jgi:hypothetical protein